MLVSEILDKAADLIEPEGAWTRGTLARDNRGLDVAAEDANATCWCAAGALQHSIGGSWSDDGIGVYHAAREAVLLAVGLTDSDRLANWNDTPGRTQQEVVTALREAARKEREAGR